MIKDIIFITLVLLSTTAITSLLGILVLNYLENLEQ